MTTQVKTAQISAGAAIIAAVIPFLLDGNPFVPDSEEGGRGLGWINDGEWVVYKNVDFGEGAL